MTVYRLALGFERPPMTMNQARSGGHWAAQREAKQDVEKAVWALAKQQHIPRLDRCTVALTWFPPAVRRSRDGDGLGIMVKACLDGLVHAGVIEDDDSSRVWGVFLRVAEHDGAARVELTLVDDTGPDCFAELLAA